MLAGVAAVAVAAMALAAVASGPLWAGPGADGPPWWDDQRSLREQQDAAEAAVIAAADALATAGDERRTALARVLATLGDDSGHVRDALHVHLRANLRESDLDLVAAVAGGRDPLAAAEAADLIAVRPPVTDAARAAVVEALLDALPRRGDAESAAAVCRALAACAGAGAHGAHGEHGGDGHDGRRAADVADALHRAGRALARRPETAAAWLQAVAAWDREGACAFLAEQADDGPPWVRGLATTLLAERAADPSRTPCAGVGPEPAGAAARAALRLLEGVGGRARGWDGPWLFHAVHALRTVPAPAEHPDAYHAAVDRMVDLLEDVHGRPRAELGAALGAITGARGLGDDPDKWRTWWDRTADGWTPPAPADASATPERAGTSRAVFFGVPVTSRRLVVVLDCSGGMDRPLADGGPPRLHVARRELERLLEGLPPESLVDAAAFASDWSRHAGRLVPAGRARRSLASWAAEQDVPEAPHSARGNLCAPLDDLLLDPSLDTVLVLTEGAPTEGRHVDPDRVARRLARRAALTRTHVQVLYCGRSRSALRDLEAAAEATGGRCWDVRDFKSPPR